MASGGDAMHEREKRFYTLNGADKLYHMAFRVLLGPLSLSLFKISNYI